MNRRGFLKAFAALAAAVAAPAVPATKSVPTLEIGRWENFRFIETETLWDLTREHGIAIPFPWGGDKTERRRQMLWASAWLKRHADEYVPPWGMAELRVAMPYRYGRESGVALYWHPGSAMQNAPAERHLDLKFDPMTGCFLLERFPRA